jgi:hypothetical protein
MQMFKKIILAATLTVAGVATSAHASLLDSTISATGTGLHPVHGTTDGTQEFAIYTTFAGGPRPQYRDYVVFDFSENTLTITTPVAGITWGDWGSYVFSGFTDTITGVTVNAAASQGFGNDLANSDLVKDLTFDAHRISFDFNGGSSQNKNARLVFDITTQSAEVPEPTTVALMGLGLLGAVAARRKSAKGNRA